MKALMVCKNRELAEYFAKLSVELVKSGHNVVSVLDKDSKNEIYPPALVACNPDIVMVSASSNKSENLEMLSVLVQAKNKNIRLALVVLENDDSRFSSVKKAFPVNFLNWREALIFSAESMSAEKIIKALTLALVAPLSKD